MAIHHVVFIKFKKEAEKKEINHFIAELNKLPERNREIKNWISGFSPEPRFHNGAFDFGLAADLADWDAMDRYMSHEFHISLGPLLRPLADYWLSFDFETDYVQPKRFSARKIEKKLRQPRLAKGKARVPWVRGHRTEAARGILEKMGLRVGNIETSVGGVWAAGRVTAQEPSKDTIVDKGSTVSLTVTGEYWMKPERP